MHQRVRIVGGQQRGGVGADGEEGDEAQVEQPGQPDLQIEAHAHQDVQADQHQHLADIRPGERRQHDQHRQRRCRAHIRRVALGIRRSATQPRCGAARRGTARSIADAMTNTIDRALHAQSFPGVEQLLDSLSDRPLLQHELDQFLEHAGHQHGHRARQQRPRDRATAPGAARRPAARPAPPPTISSGKPDARSSPRSACPPGRATAR